MPISPLSGLLAALTFLPAWNPVDACSNAVSAPDSSVVITAGGCRGFLCTLERWADEVWVYLEDRSGLLDGKLGRAGFFRRFHPKIDGEYVLDFVSSAFSPSEEAVWGTWRNGARYWAGSINHQELVTAADLRSTLPLGRGWMGRLEWTKRETPTVARSLLRVHVERSWSGRLHAFVRGSLHRDKPDIDVGVGGAWRSERVEVTASLYLLDAFSDLIYQRLGVYPSLSPWAIDYRRMPLAIRGRASLSLSERFRLGLVGALLRPTRFRAYVQPEPEKGFEQEERFQYGGILVEWRPSSWSAAAAWFTSLRADTDRRPSAHGSPEDDYRLREAETRGGIAATFAWTERWRLEAWALRSGRLERRAARSLPDLEVDYEDRAWTGRLDLGYRSAAGFRADLGVDWDLRDVLRGEDQVPWADPLGQHNVRLRTDIGWEEERWLVLAGVNWDLDGDPGFARPVFDGAHGRFAFRW